CSNAAIPLKSKNPSFSPARMFPSWVPYKVLPICPAATTVRTCARDNALSGCIGSILLSQDILIKLDSSCLRDASTTHLTTYLCLLDTCTSQSRFLRLIDNTSSPLIIVNCGNFRNTFSTAF